MMQCKSHGKRGYNYATSRFRRPSLYQQRSLTERCKISSSMRNLPVSVRMVSHLAYHVVAPALPREIDKLHTVIVPSQDLPRHAGVAARYWAVCDQQQGEAFGTLDAFLGQEVCVDTILVCQLVAFGVDSRTVPAILSSLLDKRERTIIHGLNAHQTRRYVHGNKNDKEEDQDNDENYTRVNTAVFGLTFPKMI